MTKTLEEILTGVIFCDGQRKENCVECHFLERDKDGKPKKDENGKTKHFSPSLLKEKHEKELVEVDVDDRYHVYSTGGKRDFMFIMETPGNKKNNGKFTEYVENGKLKYKDDFDKYVELKQKNFRIWMTELGLFNDENILRAINKDIVPENFFDYFHHYYYPY